MTLGRVLLLVHDGKSRELPSAAALSRVPLSIWRLDTKDMIDLLFGEHDIYVNFR
jgi:hypothetical protein